MITFPNIPSGSVLGLNYSGMHDSAIVIVDPDGAINLAISLERFSRVKQDGRFPFALIERLPWNKISKIAISTEQVFKWPELSESKLLSTRLKLVRQDGLRHNKSFYDLIDQLPCEKEFVCHQLAHAASAFWGSEFDEALCLTYDGGMMNSPWFGGIYKADRQNGICPLDQFSALHYAKMTTLYTFVTALLGYAPNKHEGKITGLAAYGRPSNFCRKILQRWFEEEFLEIESVMEWVFTNDPVHPPVLLVDEARIKSFRDIVRNFTREELAATVQEFAEHHVLEILARARELDWVSDKICLAGGLFANVKINQRILESGFRKLFVSPPMTDDGTALGAAWHVLSKQSGFSPKPLRSMYFGPCYSKVAVKRLLETEGITFTRQANPAKKVAELLAAGSVVAVFKGKMEFGPRALGNRSILAQATKRDINQRLNACLNRSETMPFAPISRVEDAEDCYRGVEQVNHAAEFMTVTLNCTESLKMNCPAVVHIDGTARPQLVSSKSNSFLYSVLTQYKCLTGKPALVNTSFNIHDQPIVCSYQDAIQGFFESSLDYLYLGDGYLISFAENKEIALKYLQLKLREPSQKNRTLSAINILLSERLLSKDTQLKEKEAELQRNILDNQNLTLLLNEKEAELQRNILDNQNLTLLLNEKEAELQRNILDNQNLTLLLKEKEVSRQQNREHQGYRLKFNLLAFSQSAEKITQRIISILSPRLGNFNQYSPRQLCTANLSTNVKQLTTTPKISIVTPSYQQGRFIESTIQSVLNQSYPNLEYYIQDGGSNDSTVAVLKKYQNSLSGWNSEEDSGQSQAINLGLTKTTGEIMSWLNADDLLLPSALHTVADYFNRHPDVDVVYGNRLLIDENDMEIGRWIMPGHDGAVLSWVDYVPQETLFWRRRIWNKVGGQIDEFFSFAMDWDLLVRFRDAGAKFAHIPHFIGAFRIHKLQKTSTAINDIGFREMDLIRKRLLNRVPTHKDIRKAITPFLLKHIAVDIAYRIKTRLRGN